MTSGEQDYDLNLSEKQFIEEKHLSVLQSELVPFYQPVEVSVKVCLHYIAYSISDSEWRFSLPAL